MAVAESFSATKKKERKLRSAQHGREGKKPTRVTRNSDEDTKLPLSSSPNRHPTDKNHNRTDRSTLWCRSWLRSARSQQDTRISHKSRLRLGTVAHITRALLHGKGTELSIKALLCFVLVTLSCCTRHHTNHQQHELGMADLSTKHGHCRAR